MVDALALGIQGAEFDVLISANQFEWCSCAFTQRQARLAQSSAVSQLCVLQADAKHCTAAP